MKMCYGSECNAWGMWWKCLVTMMKGSITCVSWHIMKGSITCVWWHITVAKIWSIFVAFAFPYPHPTPSISLQIARKLLSIKYCYYYCYSVKLLFLVIHFLDDHWSLFLFVVSTLDEKCEVALIFVICYRLGDRSSLL